MNPISFRTALVWAAVALSSRPAWAQSDPILVSSTSVVAGGRRCAVRVVKVQLSRVRLKAGLGQGRVGGTENLAALAARYRASVAINGGFFAAYTSNPVKNPSHTLITDGQVVHLGNIGSLFYTTAGHQAGIARVPLKIEGSLDGNYGYQGWYAFWLNRHPENSRTTVTIFTRYWGRTTGLSDGIQVTVSRGLVTHIGQGSQVIPPDGYVIYFRGQDALAGRFHVGQQCAYRVVSAASSGAGRPAQLQEAIGCGPRLLADGRITVDPVAEGFRDPKVLSGSLERSMVGITRDGWLILATSSGTMRQMAEVMKSLGAYQAMNLDGGASSGLWINGRYLRSPGRPLSNALLVLTKSP